MNYSLIDSGNGKKLERFGSYLIVRPASHVVWEPLLPEKEWDKADAIFTREGKSRWEKNPRKDWKVELAGIKFKLSPTDFGHLGIFPEQKDLWQWTKKTIRKALENGRKEVNVLNLFAYSGGATLSAAKAGARVCHLDASKGMVAWARENAELNQLHDKHIRWIVDDVNKFLDREIRRGSSYDGIILDPPTYGRGSQGQVFKFERDLVGVINKCRILLSDSPLFVLLSCHAPKVTPQVLHNVLQQILGEMGGKIDHGEMLLKGSAEVLPLPNGTFARWRNG